MKKQRINKFAAFLVTAFVVFATKPLEAHEISEETAKQNLFTNQKLLDSVFVKLYQLEHGQRDKVNVVHLGDSHIQADFLTNAVRQELQAKFGYGGYGFTFPYKLAKTNGALYLKYASDAKWNSKLNVSPVSGIVDIGLSGIALYSDDSNFNISLTTQPEWSFSTVKVIYSTEKPQYHLALNAGIAKEVEEQEVVKTEYQTHKIQRGETLSRIALKYKTTVKKLKEANNMRSDAIRAGKTLKIPQQQTTRQTIKKIIREDVEYLTLKTYPYYSSYTSDSILNSITLFSEDSIKPHDINGLVLESKDSGLVYHSIGVNGAKLADFSKCPLFFQQLPILKPDLVVLSFGTNESFQRLSVDQYMSEIDNLVTKIKETNPDVAILINTPPPSLIRRRNANRLVEEYSKELKKHSNFPVWDLYGKMGGGKSILNKGEFYRMIARDRIHYTIEGYETQGRMFAQDLIDAYELYKQRIEN